MLVVGWQFLSELNQLFVTQQGRAPLLWLWAQWGHLFYHRAIKQGMFSEILQWDVSTNGICQERCCLFFFPWLLWQLLMYSGLITQFCRIPLNHQKQLLTIRTATIIWQMWIILHLECSWSHVLVSVSPFGSRWVYKSSAGESELLYMQIFEINTLRYQNFISSVTIYRWMRSHDDDWACVTLTCAVIPKMNTGCRHSWWRVQPAVVSRPRESVVHMWHDGLFVLVSGVGRWQLTLLVTVMTKQTQKTQITANDKMEEWIELNVMRQIC